MVILSLDTYLKWTKTKTKQYKIKPKGGNHERENALLYIYSVIIIGQYLLICETSGYVWTLKDYIGLNFFLFFFYIYLSHV